MGLTVLQGQNNLSIVHDGSTNFDMATYYPLGVRLTAIRFFGEAANDILIVREKTGTGVHKCKLKDTGPSGVHYECQAHKSSPYILASECDITADSLIIFEFV